MFGKAAGLEEVCMPVLITRDRSGTTENHNFFIMLIIPATVVIIIVISFIVCCCPPFRLTIHSRLSSIIRHVPVIHHHASDQVYHIHSILSACSLLIYHMSQYRSWRTPCSATRCHRNTSYTLRYQSDGRHLQICDDLWFCFGMNIIHLYVVSHKYFYVYNIYTCSLFMHVYIDIKPYFQQSKLSKTVYTIFAVILKIGQYVQ